MTNGHMDIASNYRLLTSVKPAFGNGIVLVLESRGWQDYMVEVWVDGQHVGEQDYFTTDKADAVQHARAMAIYLDTIVFAD